MGSNSNLLHSSVTGRAASPMGARVQALRCLRAQRITTNCNYKFEQTMLQVELTMACIWGSACAQSKHLSASSMSVDAVGMMGHHTTWFAIKLCLA